MQTFKNYVSGNSINRKSVRVVAELMLRRVDPEKFILDFTEEHYPFIYSEVLCSLYSEADAPAGPAADPTGPGAVPTAAGGTNAKISAATGQFNQMMGGFKQASDEMGISGLLSKIGSWFSGGGAAKNFDKAMKALGKVKGVFDTIKVPDNLKQDERFANYDGFVKELDAAMQSLTKFKDAPAIAGLMDQLKKDPSVFQVNQANADAVGGSLDEDMPAPPAEGEKKADGSGEKAPATPAKNPDETDPKVVSDAIHAANTGAAGHDPEIKKILDDPANNTAMDQATKDRVKWEKVGKYLADKGREDMNTSREHRHRRGKVVSESFFEAMVLAGVPMRRKK